MKKWGLGVLGLAAATGIIALAVGVFGGVAQAQEPADQDKGAMRSEYQERLAQKLGVTVAQLETAQKAARDEMIDAAVASGRITVEQGEKLKAGEPGDFRHARGGRIRNAVGNVIDAAAEILGLSSDEVRAGLQDGKSLKELAAERGVGSLEAQLVGKLTAEIQAKLADGTITQQQADRLLENLAERVSRAVEHEGGQGGPRGQFGPGGSRQAPNQN